MQQNHRVCCCNSKSIKCLQRRYSHIQHAPVQVCWIMWLKKENPAHCITASQCINNKLLSITIYNLLIINCDAEQKQCADIVNYSKSNVSVSRARSVIILMPAPETTHREKIEKKKMLWNKISSISILQN